MSNVAASLRRALLVDALGENLLVRLAPSPRQGGFHRGGKIVYNVTIIKVVHIVTIIKVVYNVTIFIFLSNSFVTVVVDRNETKSNLNKTQINNKNGLLAIRKVKQKKNQRKIYRSN